MQFDLFLFVLVLMLVLEIRILSGTRDEYEDDDEDEVRTLQPRVELHENDIGFMKSHTRCQDRPRVQFDRKRNRSFIRRVN